MSWKDTYSRATKDERLDLVMRGRKVEQRKRMLAQFAERTSKFALPALHIAITIITILIFPPEAPGWFIPFVWAASLGVTFILYGTAARFLNPVLAKL